MPFGLEFKPAFVNEKSPYRDETGRLIVSHAPEVTWQWAEESWEETNKAMEKMGIGRKQCQILVLTNKEDVTSPLYLSLMHDPLSAFPVATTIEQEYPDRELGIFVQDERELTQSLYIVTSLLTERDFSRVRGIADHYKHVLKAKCATLVTPYLGRGRQDKNVDKNGDYKPETINIRAEIAGLSSLIDRMIVFEPHSSATQAYAAEFGIPLVPISPWRFMIDKLIQRKEISSGNTIMVRPDIGRNIAAMRAAEYLKVPSVSFSKKRISGLETEFYELTPKDQAIVSRRIALLYDDEASTLGTLFDIASALVRYRAKELIACLAHCKFTERWQEKITHPLLTLVLGTDSRMPIGNIAMSEKIQLVSLVPLIRQTIDADIKGINFWGDPYFKYMILQPFPDA